MNVKFLKSIFSITLKILGVSLYKNLNEKETYSYNYKSTHHISIQVKT